MRHRSPVKEVEYFDGGWAQAKTWSHSLGYKRHLCLLCPCTDDDAPVSRGGLLCNTTKITMEKIGFIVLAGASWWATVYWVLKWQRFPFHHHMLLIGAVVAVPVAFFTAVMAVVEGWVAIGGAPHEKKR
jgi:hypothetical protein